MKTTLHCSVCGFNQELKPSESKTRRRYGLEPKCPKCHSVMQYNVSELGTTDNQRRSQAQEERVAAREGAKRQAASGSRPGYEGDVRKVGAYRGECKFTRAKSFALKLEVLRQLEMQADYGELPVLDLEFQGNEGHWRYVVLPEWAYEILMKESGRRCKTPTS
jgi:phage FluMu protein Com